jgi:hypothetical protein
MAHYSLDSLITHAHLAGRVSFLSKNGSGECLDLGKYHVMAVGKFGDCI